MTYPRRITIALGVLAIAAIAAIGVAAAAPECSTTEIGIDCDITGSTTVTVTTSVPPLRYLATGEDPELGPCWYWSRYPPGLDTWDPYNDPAVLTTKWLLPECPERPGTTSTATMTTAWSVFRSFPLARPTISLRPEVGITNLPTLLGVTAPSALDHTEVLPDGRTLVVEAEVETVWIDWGDGTPQSGYPAATAFVDGAAHPYPIKTCPPDYRDGNPSGWRCHPTLEAYPVSVTFSWVGRYRTGTTWIRLGTIDRTSTRLHDVDEVVGVLVAP